MEVEQSNSFNMAQLKFQNWLYRLKVAPDLNIHNLREAFHMEDEVLHVTQKGDKFTIHCNSARGKFNYKKCLEQGHKSLGAFYNISTKNLRRNLKCSTL